MAMRRAGYAADALGAQLTTRIPPKIKWTLTVIPQLLQRS
jgi:hypothetical protein